jgi:hypothetical protein
VHDAGPGGHALDVARPDDRTGAEIVLVLQGAVENVGHDLHVAMAVRRKAGTGLDDVVVENAQHGKPHVLGIVVVGERERVPGIEPAMVGMAAILRVANGDHDRTPFEFGLDAVERGSGEPRSNGNTSRSGGHERCGLPPGRGEHGFLERPPLARS